MTLTKCWSWQNLKNLKNLMSCWNWQRLKNLTSCWSWWNSMSCSNWRAGGWTGGWSHHCHNRWPAPTGRCTRYLTSSRPSINSPISGGNITGFRSLRKGHLEHALRVKHTKYRQRNQHCPTADQRRVTRAFKAPDTPGRGPLAYQPQVRFQLSRHWPWGGRPGLLFPASCEDPS